MPTIEQVSKRVFSDREWLKKCAIGGAISIVPLVNILAMGYLYQLFVQGRRGRDIALPEWSDLKGLALDGLRFLLIGLIFAGLPIGLVTALSYVAFDGLIAQIPLIPVVFLAGPVMSAALYLYTVKGDIADSFNFEALGIMLQRAAISYVVPTLAFLGLCLLCWPIIPVAFFFGGVFYFYLMGFAYRDLELKRR